MEPQSQTTNGATAVERQKERAEAMKLVEASLLGQEQVTQREAGERGADEGEAMTTEQ